VSVSTAEALGRYTELNDAEEVSELEPGLDFRLPQYRREVFLRFFSFHLRYGSHPGCVYFLMPYLAARCGWTMEEKLWFAYINGCTQHPPTSYMIWRRFPDVHTLNEDLFADWFNSVFGRLGWDTDRRHQKAQFLACVSNYREQLAGRSQEDFFESLGSDDPYEYFRSAWEVVRGTFLSFGRLSAFSYLEYLRVMGIELDCGDLFLEDMSGSKSHRNGLAKVLGRDDLDWHHSGTFTGSYSPGQVEWLKAEAELLLHEAKARHVDDPWARAVSYFTMESALCTYKSWHRPNRRYPNVYVDMLYLRLKQAEQNWPDEDFSIFWDARRDLLPSYLLLEDNPQDVGVKALKQNWYRETGEVLGMARDDPVFECGYEAACLSGDTGVTERDWERRRRRLRHLYPNGRTF
jgi:hypothetical protein